jgi:hypothetical protein
MESLPPSILSACCSEAMLPFMPRTTMAHGTHLVFLSAAVAGDFWVVKDLEEGEEKNNEYLASGNINLISDENNSVIHSVHSYFQFIP